MVELVPPNGTKQSYLRNEEKRIKGLEEVEPQVGQTRDGNPLSRVGQPVIGLSCSENILSSQSMIRHSSNTSESWKKLPWFKSKLKCQWNRETGYRTRSRKMLR